MRETELLAPAGNKKSVFQAIHNGADAVYIGGKSFGARAYANNFSYDEMKHVIDYAHLYGVKVFVTANTLAYQREIDDFLAHVQKVYQMGADALIMQDVGMIVQTTQRFPDIEIHASTQMHNHNNASLCFAKQLGMTRAVLAREMSLEQIKSLDCDIEKEVFIHGALCISCSGQCLMSALTEQRSGNRGKCAQSCRMRYAVTDSRGNTIDKGGDFALSPKDLALLEDIEALLDAGIRCFKIEGRMKSPEYVGQVTKTYNALLAQYASGQTLSADQEDRKAIEKLFNRGFTKGHLYAQTGGGLMGVQRPNHKGVPLGQVISVSKGRIEIKLDSPLAQGDGIKFEQSDSGFICNKIYVNGKLKSEADAGQIISLDKKAHVQKGERVVKTSDIRLIEKLRQYKKKKISVDGQVTARKGEKLSLTLRDADAHVVTEQSETIQQSKTRPTTQEDIRASISRLGDTPFVLDTLNVDADDDIFIAKSQINALRRKAVEALSAERMRISTRLVKPYKHTPIQQDEQNEGCLLHVLVRNARQLDAVKGLITGDIYTSDARVYSNMRSGHPNLRLKTDKLAKQTDAYSGERLLVTDNGGLYAYHQDNDIVLDYSLNALNAHTLGCFAAMSANRVALSPELGMGHLREMIKAFRQMNGQTPAVEALVYARYELMAMQHCVIGGEKNCGRCRDEQYFLCDIKGNDYPIVTDGACNNYILSRLYEQKDIGVLKALGVRHFRVELFDEDASQSRDIVARYLKQTGEPG